MHALLVGQKFDGLLEGVEGILETEEVVQVEGEVKAHLLSCILVCQFGQGLVEGPLHVVDVLGDGYRSILHFTKNVFYFKL